MNNTPFGALQQTVRLLENLLLCVWPGPEARIYRNALGIMRDAKRLQVDLGIADQAIAGIIENFGPFDDPYLPEIERKLADAREALPKFMEALQGAMEEIARRRPPNPNPLCVISGSWPSETGPLGSHVSMLAIAMENVRGLAILKLSRVGDVAYSAMMNSDLSKDDRQMIGLMNDALKALASPAPVVRRMYVRIGGLDLLGI